MQFWFHTSFIMQKNRFGVFLMLRPAHIPSRPFSTVSLDLITGLPQSGEEKFTAVLVIVDKLTKFAIIIPLITNSIGKVSLSSSWIEWPICSVYPIVS